jgi:hypothetical protein
MPLPNPFLIITLSDATDRQPRSLSVRCSHGQSTLPLPSTPNPPAERAATALVVLQHYSATGCACTGDRP